MLSEQGLQKFIDLYEKKYSIKLSKQEAFEMFSQLVRMIKLVHSSDISVNPSFTNG